MNELKINIIEKKYSNTTILENINIIIQEPGIYGVIGKNGSGKTTLFNSILNETSYKGEILYNNKNVKLKNVGYLPTDPFLYDELTIKEFYSFYHQLTNNETIDIKDVSLLFDLDSTKFIKSLSTGMKKKVSINTLFFEKNSKFYIFDEPFHGLDIESNITLINKLKEISKTKIILISSHILSSLFDFCNEIYLLKNKFVIHFKKNDFQNIESHF